MNKTLPAVSVVIPVYNDEQYLQDCLSAVMTQTVPPLEIIVIDNNCSDSSMHIARQFKGVRIIKERRQGLSFARNAGFNAAVGDIILRIDADTILSADHIEKLINKANQHPDVAGFTGYGISRNILLPKASLLWSWGYFTFSHAYLGYPMLWGANMAIRRTYWQQIKPTLINNDMAVHEDQDISLALACGGGKAAIFRDLTVSVNMQKLLEYSQYRKYGLMLHLLKILNKQHVRYALPTRLPKTNRLKRTVYWLASVWGVYFFYIITIFYTIYKKVRL